MPTDPSVSGQKSVKPLLALETSGRSGSVAIAFGDSTNEVSRLRTDSELLDHRFGSAKTLAPAIQRLLDRNRITVPELGCIAVITGPGSFTGLRVGVATGKAMSYAAQVPLVEVDTLHVIAAQYASTLGAPAANTNHFFCVLDAYRGQVFESAFRCEFGSATQLPSDGTRIVDTDLFLRRLQSLQQGTQELIRVVGPGCARILEFLSSDDEASVEFAALRDSCQWIQDDSTLPRAVTVATLGWQAFGRGDTISPFAILPRYYRASAAEEKVAR